MMRIILLILIVSSNCIKSNCDEEIRSTETATHTTDKADLHLTETEPSQTKVTNEAVNKESKSKEDNEEIRISRSSSSGTTVTDKESDDSSKVHSSEVSVTEKSVNDGVTIETNRQGDRGINEPKPESNQEETVQVKTKSTENIQKVIEEYPETSRSGAAIEDRKSMELLEASAESKINDYEKTSLKMHESDRTLSKEKLNESASDENLPTRRMLSEPGPDYIVTVIDAKTNTDTTPGELDLEVKIIPNQNINMYNFNEFGTENYFKLGSPPTTTPRMPTRETFPDTTRKASQELLEQQYLPKLYPQAELNMHFPNLNSDFQASRDLPIYLKLNQNELKPKNVFLQPHNSHFKYNEENAYSNSHRQKQHYQPQNMFDQRRNLAHRKIPSYTDETKNQAQQFEQNLQRNVGRLRNKPYINVYQTYRNPVQQFNQAITNPNLNHIAKLNSDPSTQMQNTVNTNMQYNNKELRNQYPYYQPRRMANTNINLQDKQLRNNVFTNAYPHIHRPNRQDNNLLNTLPSSNNIVTPKKIKVLFQKLPNTPILSVNLPTNFHVKTLI